MLRSSVRSWNFDKQETGKMEQNKNTEWRRVHERRYDGDRRIKKRKKVKILKEGNPFAMNTHSV